MKWKTLSVALAQSFVCARCSIMRAGTVAKKDSAIWVTGLLLVAVLKQL